MSLKTSFIQIQYLLINKLINWILIKNELISFIFDKTKFQQINNILEKNVFLLF